MLFFCLHHLTECSIHALGMENNLLPNSAITASSVWPQPGHDPWLARLNNVPIIGMSWGSWSAASNEAGQWLQIDLGEERLVTKLATQGRPSWDQWVTSYTILFSSHNVKWEEYKENDFVKVCDAFVLFFFKRNLSHTRKGHRHLPSPIFFNPSEYYNVKTFRFCSIEVFQFV